MNKKNMLLLLTVLFMTLAITAVASAGQPETSTVYWWWEEEAGSAQIVRTPNGIHGNFSSSLANDSGSAHGLAVTLWLVIFNNPAACGELCNDADLGNPDVMPDVLYATGNVIGHSETANLGFSRNAGDNSGSIANLFGLPTNDGEPWGLVDPMAAEIHYVLRFHGPTDAAQMPAQIQSYEGGCVFNAPFGYNFPAGSDDLYLGAGDCQDVQFAVNLP